MPVPAAEEPRDLAGALEKIAHLELALSTARLIGAAVGILMATARLTYDDAFTLLSQASQSTNSKLRDIAESVVLTGSIPVVKRACSEPTG